MVLPKEDCELKKIFLNKPKNTEKRKNVYHIYSRFFRHGGTLSLSKNIFFFNYLSKTVKTEGGSALLYTALKLTVCIQAEKMK